MNKTKLSIPTRKLETFCRRWQVVELSLFGRPVDLVEKEALRNPCRKREILGSAQVIYAA